MNSSASANQRPEAAAPPVPAAGAPCANCGHALTQPPPNFCPHCGQETHIRPPRLGEFLQQFGGAYLSTEGAFWRTLKLLLLKPGELTAQYLAGRRKHYVLPLRLYLTISVIVLLIMRATASLQIQVDAGDIPKEKPRSAILSLGFGQAGLRDGVFFCDKLPQWLCNRVQKRLDIQPAQFQQEVEAASDRFVAHLGTAMFLLLPSFALWFKLVYWGRRLRYTEHLVFALHVHAFWFLMFGLMTTGVGWLAVPAMLAIPAYTLLAMRRAYGGRWWPRMARAAVVTTLYSVVMLLVLIIVGLWAVLA